MAAKRRFRWRRWLLGGLAASGALGAVVLALSIGPGTVDVDAPATASGRVGDVGAMPATAAAAALEMRLAASVRVDTEGSWVGERAAALTALGGVGAALGESVRSALHDAAVRAEDAAIGRFGVRLLRAHEDGDGGALRWERAGPTSRTGGDVVLLVHGLDEPGTIWDDVAPALRDAGLEVARLDYPNDGPIAQSADLLADSLRLLRSIGARRVCIVGHSMGGLVARDVLTRPEHYDGFARRADDPGGERFLPDVPRLVMIGTPNAGSPLAPLRGVMEWREHGQRWLEGGGLSGGALAFMADGTGEAARDLTPGSRFLKDLNARPLPSGVKITIITGAASPFAAADVREMLRRNWPRSVLGHDGVEAIATRVDVVDRVIGDGAVGRDSALLRGVTDVVEISANHRSLVKRAEIERKARDAAGLEQTPAGAIPALIERLCGPETDAPGDEPR